MLITLRTQWFCKVANFLMSLFCSEFPSDFRGGVGFCLSADRHSFSLPQILSETLERRQLRTNFKSSASFFSSGRKTSRRENFLQKLCQRNFGNGKMNGSSNGYFFPVSLFWRQFGTEKNPRSFSRSLLFQVSPRSIEAQDKNATFFFFAIFSSHRELERSKPLSMEFKSGIAGWEKGKDGKRREGKSDS